MKGIDLIRLADQVRAAHARHQSWRLPAMTIQELGILARLLESPVVRSSTVLH